MYPHTRQLLDELIREEADAPPADVARAERGPESDDRVYQMMLKRRYHSNILRRMLEDAGYKDLARSTTIRRASVEESEDGY